jgi:enterochelin esterase-like enzyme
VFEPQGIFFFLALLIAFGALLLWLAKARRIVFRLIAGGLAFIPAMLFGVEAVNKYYDYYQSWDAITADFTNQGVNNLPQAPHLGNKGGNTISRLGLSPEARAEAAQTGYLFETVISGKLSGISRTAYIYLPPQYFQSRYARYRFPAIELLHGSPGSPEQWVDPMNLLPTLDDMVAAGKADPVVLVLPDTDGGKQYSLQCLNAVGGLKDATYVAEDVPDFAAASYRVQPPGQAWGIAGLSEGGFCAANLALQYPNRFGDAGSMSGYFAPLDNLSPRHDRAGAPPIYTLPFRGHPALKARNTPAEYITRRPAGALIPRFFLSAGAQDGPAVRAAESFRQELQLDQANVPLILIPGASHDAKAWRNAERPMFAWMTPQLARQATLANQALAARERVSRGRTA